MLSNMGSSLPVAGGGPAVLSTEQAAAYVGLSRSTLEKSRVRGDGPAYLKLGQSVRYRPDDLELWLAGKRVTSTSERRS